VLIATHPRLGPEVATSNRVVVLEDVRGAADGLVASLAEGGLRPLVGGVSWDSLLTSGPADTAALIVVAHSVNSTIAALCAENRRKDPLLPVVCVLTSTGPADVVRLLEAGAHDVLSRQLDRFELRARIAAHIRRASPVREMETDAHLIPSGPEVETFGSVVVDSRAREVRVGGRPVKLGRLEFELVEYLSRNAGVAISWDQMSTQLYGFDADVSTERLEILARRVRAKLAADQGQSSNLVAVPGWGYRWERRESERAGMVGARGAA
jgi:two-component system, OmpR family, response regulator TctD